MVDIKKYSPPWDLRKRGMKDHARHEEKIREAIKKNLKKLIIEESFITSRGDKKIKIPIKYLDQYRFKFNMGKKERGVGHGDGNIGDPIAYDPAQDSRPPNTSRPNLPSTDEGQDIYTAEIDVEDIVKIMAEDLGLPWYEPKDRQQMKVEDYQFTEISKKGILPNLDLKRSLFENLKRMASKGLRAIGPFEQNDLRYKNWETVEKFHSSACIYMLLDKSGSLTEGQLYIIKSFFFWTARLLRQKYDKLNFVFIAHDTKAKIVEEDEFFKYVGSGGTKCSTAFRLALDHIKKYNPSASCNNYVFAFSDGENWPEDNDECSQYIKELLNNCQAVGYGEVEYTDDFYGSGFGTKSTDANTLFGYLRIKISHPNFLASRIRNKDDVYNTIKKFLNQDEYGTKK